MDEKFKTVWNLYIDTSEYREVGWPNSGKTVMGKHHIYYSRNDTQQKYEAIIVKKEKAKAVIGSEPLSDRAALLKIFSWPPQSISSRFTQPQSNLLKSLKEFLKLTKKHELVISSWTMTTPK